SPGRCRTRVGDARRRRVPGYKRGAGNLCCHWRPDRDLVVCGERHDPATGIRDYWRWRSHWHLDPRTGSRPVHILGLLRHTGAVCPRRRRFVGLMGKGADNDPPAPIIAYNKAIEGWIGYKDIAA